jgi:hypothetical protein
MKINWQGSGKKYNGRILETGIISLEWQSELAAQSTGPISSDMGAMLYRIVSHNEKRSAIIAQFLVYGNGKRADLPLDKEWNIVP